METMILNCVQCTSEFEFSIHEQKKFQQRGFDFPLRCPQCRKNKSRDSERPEIRKIKNKKRHYRQKYENFDY